MYMIFAQNNLFCLRYIIYCLFILFVQDVASQIYTCIPIHIKKNVFNMNSKKSFFWIVKRKIRGTTCFSSKILPINCASVIDIKKNTKRLYTNSFFMCLFISHTKRKSLVTSGNSRRTFYYF